MTSFFEYTDKLKNFYPAPGSSADNMRSANVAANVELVHAVLGLSGEVGELTDAIKKPLMYGKPWDNANILEELGDCYHFLDRLAEMFGHTDRDCREANIQKLTKRFPQGYTNQAATVRADKDGKVSV